MRFGLGWRAQIGAGILAHRDRIDVVEVMAEDFVDADAKTRRALQFLAAHMPVVVHATSLGLASSELVDRKKLDDVARVIGWLEPELWSEHLAFVRASGLEIGHLAAPPRNAATLEGLRRNVELATRVTGSAPLLENVATLIDPPLSEYDEAEWLRAIDSDLLLDLHNLHANAVNFGFDAVDVLARIPHERVRAVHLAGGRRIERNRILDDHLHEVPDPVYELLAYVANEKATVILERDGNYPPIEELLAELDRARGVARKHLETRADRTKAAALLPQSETGDPGTTGFGLRQQSCRFGFASGSETASSAAALQTFLAKLYVDDNVRQRFLAAPYAIARSEGLDDASASHLAAMPQDDLLLAARGFAHKRAVKSMHQPR